MATSRDIYKGGRLTARPGLHTKSLSFTKGLHPLQLRDSRDGFLYIPKNYTPGQAASLAVMLHGAGGRAEHGLDLLRKYADASNIILLAPASKGASWDIIDVESFDVDVIFIDQALTMVFETYSIDPARLAIGGFSDGASYALSIGLSNGDLFSHIIAFSPGFAYTKARVGKPGLFISHGVEDTVLSINHCSRRLVPQFQNQGYEVNYQEFSNGHQIPESIAEAASAWFSGA